MDLSIQSSSSRWNSSSLEKDKPFIQSKIKILGFEIDFYILFIIVPNDKSENYRSEFANNTELFLKQLIQ